MHHVRGWLINRVGWAVNRTIKSGRAKRATDWWLRKHFGVTAQEIHGGRCRCHREF